jgi:thiamine-monophosphate kinase
MSSRYAKPSLKPIRRSLEEPARDALRGDTIPLGPGGEFQTIGSLVARWGAAARGIGDDCALLPVPAREALCVSTDTSVEGVHFRRDWLSPRQIGYRATAAALSDLAAVAAAPLGVLTAITLPDAWRDALGDLADGIAEAAAAAGAPIVGGDTTRGPQLSITVTALGSAFAPVGRSGARVADRVYVTGRFGGPLMALRALARGERPDPAHMERFARPEPRIREARWLAERGADALIDISDGLAGDLGHLAAASGAHLQVFVDKLPVLAGVDQLEAFGSGEEYELVACLPDKVDVQEFEQEFGVPLTEIGRVLEGAALVRARFKGDKVELPSGHDHFAGR